MNEVRFHYLDQDLVVKFETDKATHEGNCCKCEKHGLGNVHIVRVKNINNDQGVITLNSDVGKQITRYAMQNLGAGKLICDNCFRSGSKQVPTNF